MWCNFEYLVTHLNSVLRRLEALNMLDVEHAVAYHNFAATDDFLLGQLRVLRTVENHDACIVCSSGLHLLIQEAFLLETVEIAFVDQQGWHVTGTFEDGVDLLVRRHDAVGMSEDSHYSQNQKQPRHDHSYANNKIYQGQRIDTQVFRLAMYFAGGSIRMDFTFSEWKTKMLWGLPF
jgi:hypothetical protein